jgi:hypothetical protein
VKYEAEIKADRFVLVVHGTPEELERARTILAATSPISVEEHEPTLRNVEPAVS